MMKSLWQDLRYGARMLWKAPGFTLIAVLSLALGIGVNTALFSVVNALLRRPLPVEQPEKLVRVHRGEFGSFSYPVYTDLRNRNRVFTDLAVMSGALMGFGTGSESEIIGGEIVSGNYFSTLGVRPALGRTFSPEEDQTPGTHPVAVLSYRFWQNRFGADPGVIGKSVVLNGHTFTVIGVAPESFTGAMVPLAPELWVPVMMQAQVRPRGGDILKDRRAGWLESIGRLKPSVSPEQAEAHLNHIATQLAQDDNERSEPGRRTIILYSANGITPQGRTPAAVFTGILMAVLGLVLVVGCVNVANLLLARAAKRRKEIAVRLAMGASRARLVRQLLTESVLLSLLGGACGSLIALWLTDLLFAFKPPIPVSIALNVSMDASVLGFALLLSVATGILFGLAPALQASHPDLISSLKDDAGSGRYRKSRLRNGLVIAQVAVSLVLLISAGLFLRSLQKAQGINPGFNPSNVLLVPLGLDLRGYTEAQGQLFYRQLIERVRGLPGVQAVSLAEMVPLGFGNKESSLLVEGQEPPPGSHAPLVDHNSVAPGYFETMEIPIRRGRPFRDEDREGAAGVVIINETFARRFFFGQDPLGKRIRTSREAPWLEIIGVVHDGKYRTLGEDARPYFYSSILQDYAAEANLHVRTAGDPAGSIAALRREVQSLDNNLPVPTIQTINEYTSISLLPARLAAWLLGAFGLIALLLAAVGIYGVMSYVVSGRQQEIGIRMAIGAQSQDVLRLIVKQGMTLVVIGLSVGLILSFVATRLLRSLLYGISATDLLTFAGVSLLLAVVALIAILIPARRATKVDPMAALRYE